MTELLKSIDSRTKLVGENRMELLLFRLHTDQLFAMNVFKIQEVLTLPKMTQMPKANAVVKGAIHLRGRPLPVFDLALAIGIGKTPVKPDSTIIVTEYNRSVQAFLIGSVDRIVNLNWEDILPPPKGTGRAHYLTALTRMDKKLVEIIDVEKVLSEVVPPQVEVSEEILDRDLIQQGQGREVLIVDDSATARAQVTATLESLGIKVHAASDGEKGLTMLKEMSLEHGNLKDKLLLVITDAEMPVMDGYTLTTMIRQDENLKDLYVTLHTSLSGEFNKSMVEKVGCDNFLSKFQPDSLAELVQERLRTVLGN